MHRNQAIQANQFQISYGFNYQINYYQISSLSLNRDDNEMKLLITPLKLVYDEYIKTNCLSNPLDPLSINRAYKSDTTRALLAYLKVTEGLELQSLHELSDDFKLPASVKSYDDASQHFGLVRESLLAAGDKKTTTNNRISRLGRFFEFYFLSFPPELPIPLRAPRLKNPTDTFKWCGKNLTRQSTRGKDLTKFGKRLSSILEQTNLGPFQFFEKLTQKNLPTGDIKGHDLSNWINQRTLPANRKMKSIRVLEESILAFLHLESHPLANTLPRNFLSSVASTVSFTHDEIVGESKDENGKIHVTSFKQPSGQRRASNLKITKDSQVWQMLRAIVEKRVEQSNLKLHPVCLTRSGTLSKSKGGQHDGLLCLEKAGKTLYAPGQSVYVQAFCAVVNIARLHSILSVGEESVHLWVSTVFLHELSEISNPLERSTALRNYRTVRAWLFQVNAGDILTVEDSYPQLPERFKSSEGSDSTTKEKLSRLTEKYSSFIQRASDSKKKTVRLYLERNFSDFPENTDIKRIYAPFMSRVNEIYASRNRYHRGSFAYHNAVRKAAVLAVLVCKPMRIGSLAQARFSANGYFTNNSFHKSGNIWSFESIESKNNNKPSGFLFEEFTQIFDEYAHFSRDFFLPKDGSVCDLLFPNGHQSASSLYDLAADTLANIKGVNFTAHVLRTLCGTVLCMLGKPEVAAGMLNDTLETVLKSYADCLPNNRSSQWHQMIVKSNPSKSALS